MGKVHLFSEVRGPGWCGTSVAVKERRVTHTRMSYEPNAETRSAHASYSPVITIDCPLDREPERLELSPSSEVFGLCQLR